jgi:UDP-GlcNAc:undecaprenyl-phosphate/decaprenyl-phosphate GlcNAc-1-phosphate transferase
MDGRELYQAGPVLLHFLSEPRLRELLLPIAMAFLVATALTRLLVRIAPSKGWVVIPRQDRWNKTVVAQFGGVPILLAVTLAALLLPPTRQTLMLLLLAWGMALLGLADDIAGLTPKAKLLGETVLAGLAVYAGVLPALTPHFWVNALFTVFWIVGITNAFNLLDNMDGLAAGVAIIALAQVILLGGLGSAIGPVALCMLASIAGFLFLNVNPARVFMGDVGSLSIGFFIACASIEATAHLSSLASVLFVPCLILFIPIFDTLLVSVTRRMNGRPISQGACDHASHRLVLAGFTERQAVALLYAIASGAGVMAFWWKSSRGDLGAAMVALFVIGSALFWVHLAKLDLPRSWLSEVRVGAIAVPRWLQQVAAKISVIALDGILITLGLYFAHVARFGRLDKVLFGRFLFAAALSIAAKLLLLLAFGAYRRPWGIASRKDIYPILQAVAVGGCLLAAASVALPKSKTIEPSIILLDAMLTPSLLLLFRGLASVFEDLLTRPGLPEADRPLAAQRSQGAAKGTVANGLEQLEVGEKTAAVTPEREQTLN